LFDEEDDLLENTKNEIWMFGDLQELKRYIRGDDEFDGRTAERHHQALVVRKRGRTKQRAAAQQREYASLGHGRWTVRPIVKNIYRLLRQREQILRKHHREWTKVAMTLQ